NGRPRPSGRMGHGHALLFLRYARELQPAERRRDLREPRDGSHYSRGLEPIAVQYTDQLFAQELISEQFKTVIPEPLPPQSVLDPGGAITGLSSNTLTVGGKTGTVQNIEAPQAIGTNANVNFQTVNVSNKPTTRSNLGLGGLATQSAGAAVPNLTQTISNPPTQTEVQNIQTKVNDLLTSLRNAGIITP